MPVKSFQQNIMYPGYSFSTNLQETRGRQENLKNIIKALPEKED